MKRFAIAFGLVVLAGACDKPSDQDCRQAITNMQALMGTASPTRDIAGDVRRCKGGSTKKAVACAIKATSVEELRACGFLKIPEHAGSGAGAAGSGAAGSGGAGSGGAGSGSAAP